MSSQSVFLTCTQYAYGNQLSIEFVNNSVGGQCMQRPDLVIAQGDMGTRRVVIEYEICLIVWLGTAHNFVCFDFV